MQTPLAVVIADIDAFKAYNDTLGHPEADECLVAVADVIRHSVHRAGAWRRAMAGRSSSC